MINATPHPHRAQGNNHTKTTHHQPAVSNPGKHPPHRRGSEAGITKQTTPTPKKGAQSQMASQTWHTVEFSRNRHTPPRPSHQDQVRHGAATHSTRATQRDQPAADV